MTVVESVLAGDLRALARLLTQVENDTPEGQRSLSEIFPHTGKAHLVGVTGAPGTGKSSLVNQVALQYRKLSTPEANKVAVIAVDPSSPFTGGALLGDRVRMRDLAGDPGVFIRSMASRGSLGGLAQATAGAAQVLDAAGFDVILIETVGAGQAEVEIAKLAHTTLVVEAPGFGDDIQASKAGILEIADILVVNKSDLPGADSTERFLRAMLELAHPVAKTFRHHGQVMKVAAGETEQKKMWVPPVLRTVATDGRGVEALLDAIGQHAQHLRQSGEWERRERHRLEVELEVQLREALVHQFHAGISEKRYQDVLEQVMQRNLSPRQAVSALIKKK